MTNIIKNTTMGQFLIDKKDYLTKALGGQGRVESFIRDVLSAVVQNEQLQRCEQVSVLNASIQANTLGLSITPQLGLAYLVPYGNKCTLILSYKGLYMLALRSGNYEQIRCTDVRVGELHNYNPISGLYEFTPLPYEVRNDAEVIGYFAYLVYKNGFRAEIFMTNKEIEEHCTKFSPSFKRGDKIWKEHRDVMYSKVVLRKLLRAYADISAHATFAEGFCSDGAVFNSDTVGDTSYEYPELVTIDDSSSLDASDILDFGDEGEKIEQKEKTMMDL